MLVVARKFNDIFYAMSTEEWGKSDRHDLLIMTHKKTKDEFPFVELFDNVYFICVPNNILHSIYSVLKIHEYFRRKKYNYVVLGNVAIVSHLYLLKILEGSQIIIVEDGLMNYLDFKSSQRFTKRLYEFILGIKEKVILSSIFRTYLLLPEEAVYFYGSASKLSINYEFILANLKCRLNLEGKKIFVGQPLYKLGLISVDEYVNIVNSIIAEYKIDYYLPHLHESYINKIECELLDLSESKLTLEIYASFCDFELYGFSSSLLYSTKYINPLIKTNAVKCDFIDYNFAVDFIYKHVDNVIIYKSNYER